MPLGTEVGLGPDHIVLDGDPALPLQRGTAPPPPSIFGPCLLWAHGWMDQVALGAVVGLHPSDIVLDGDPAPPKRGTAAPHLFGPCLL